MANQMSTVYPRRLNKLSNQWVTRIDIHLIETRGHNERNVVIDITETNVNSVNNNIYKDTYILLGNASDCPIKTQNSTIKMSNSVVAGKVSI